MHNKDLVRQGGKVQCTWKASLFCILMIQCTLTIATALGVFVCLRHHRAAAGVLENVLIFTVLAWFTLLFRTMPMPARHSLSTVRLRLN